MHPITLYLITSNSLAFLTNGIDKWLAVHQKSRIPEKILLLFSLFGGTLGAGLAMLVFRHKTSKMSFLWKFFGIMALQIVFTYLFMKN